MKARISKLVFKIMDNRKDNRQQVDHAFDMMCKHKINGDVVFKVGDETYRLSNIFPKDRLF